jgi:solute carrier family 25 carnitine/acylcarnitine transporter 20/29
MQGQGGQQLYSGPLDAVRKLYAQGGLKSVFRGTGATLARDGPGSAAYVLIPYSAATMTDEEPTATLLRTNW